MIVSVLIVPYGIETWSNEQAREIQDCFNRTLWNWNISSIFDGRAEQIVLIVPYGIETFWYWPFQALLRFVLIVPYGIETRYKNLVVELEAVLIVPYGIETVQCFVAKLWKRHRFNRTLWNWNFFITCYLDGLFCFNRTLWNWNLTA